MLGNFFINCKILMRGGHKFLPAKNQMYAEHDFCSDFYSGPKLDFLWGDFINWINERFSNVIFFVFFMAHFHVHLGKTLKNKNVRFLMLYNDCLN